MFITCSASKLTNSQTSVNIGLKLNFFSQGRNLVWVPHFLERKCWIQTRLRQQKMRRSPSTNIFAVISDITGCSMSIPCRYLFLTTFCSVCVTGVMRCSGGFCDCEMVWWFCDQGSRRGYIFRSCFAMLVLVTFWWPNHLSILLSWCTPNLEVALG